MEIFFGILAILRARGRLRSESGLRVSYSADDFERGTITLRGCRRDGLRHAATGVAGSVVALVFLLLVKLPISVEVVTGA